MLKFAQSMNQMTCFLFHPMISTKDSVVNEADKVFAPKGSPPGVDKMVHDLHTNLHSAEIGWVGYFIETSPQH